MREAPSPVPDLLAAQMVEPSPMIRCRPRRGDYAAPLLTSGRDWLEVVTALMHAIHRDFTLRCWDGRRQHGRRGAVAPQRRARTLRT